MNHLQGAHRSLTIVVLIAAAYFITGKLGLTLAIVNPSATAVWPPTGIAIASLMIFGMRAWPGVLLGAFLVNQSTASSVVTSLTIAGGNTLEAVAAAGLVTRYAGGLHVFERMKHIFLFVVLAGMLSSMISATVGVTALSVGGFARWADAAAIWWTWWLGDAAGALLIAPAVLLWYVNPRVRWRRAQSIELAVLVLAVLTVAWIVFGTTPRRWTFLCVPLCIWAGGRFSQREAASVSCVLSLIAIGATIRGVGAFAGLPTNEALLTLQSFMAVTAIVGITIAAAVAEREAAEARVCRLNEKLEQRVADRTAELQATVDELRTTERRLAEAQHVAKIGSWEWEIAEDRVWWSEELYRIFAVDAASFRGRYQDYLKVVHPDDRATVEERVKAALDNICEPFHVEHRIVRPDGHVRIVAAHARVIRHAHEADSPSAMIGTAQDVTERKQLEAELQQLQKMEAVGLLAGGIAHDFNNMLTAILGYSDMMLSQIDDDKPIARDLREIQNVAKSAAALTQQLLVFSRKQVLRLVAVDVNSVVTDVEQILRHTLGDDVRIITILAPNLYRIEADVIQLQQVLVNLALNARDAMPQGGELTFETTNVELIRGEGHDVSLMAPGGYVRLIVRDTGHGMNAATKARIFEPFFTTKERGQGTGLGLAMVHSLVQQLGGTIAVESSLGFGSTFILDFPMTLKPVFNAVTPTMRHTNAVGSEVLLVVEDNSSVRTFVTTVLTRHGYQVLECDAPIDALARARELPGPIHLLLTDMIMPDMTGRELAMQIQHERPEIRVLYMSGYTGDTMEQRRGPIDGDELLEKPFTSADLLRRVRRALDVEAHHQGNASSVQTS